MRAVLWLAMACSLAGCASGVAIGAGEHEPPAARQQDDRQLAAAVTRALVGAGDVPAQDIRVESQNGAVILRGTVPDAAAKQRAGAIASDVPGVTGVDNALAIRAR